MFSWNEALSLGIEEIDAQHKHLFAWGEKVHRQIEACSGQLDAVESIRAIHELAAYTCLHFETEARLFDQYAYPEAAEHEHEHRMFIEYLKSKDLAIRDENREEALKDLLKFFALWIFKHIESMDFQYREFMVSRILTGQ